MFAFAPQWRSPILPLGRERPAAVACPATYLVGELRVKLLAGGEGVRVARAHDRVRRQDMLKAHRVPELVDEDMF